MTNRKPTRASSTKGEGAVPDEVRETWYRVEFYNPDSEEAKSDGWVILAPTRIWSLEEVRVRRGWQRKDGTDFDTRYRVVKVEKIETVLESE